MDKVTMWLVRVAAVLVSTWATWTLISAIILQMVNLSLQNRQLQTDLQICQGKSGAPAH